MADITPRSVPSRQTIQSYGEGGFRIAGQSYRGSVLVFPDRTVAWPVASAEAIALDALQPVLADGRARVLLVGCGARATMLDGSVRRALRTAGIAVETMDTGAACRTFNVLLGEDRDVAAALVAVA